MAKNLVVMMTQFITLFADAFKAYGNDEQTQWDVFEIPNNNKEWMQPIEYFFFKKDIVGAKRKFYKQLREKFLQQARDYDRIVFINLFWDEEYFIDTYVAEKLQDKDCRIYFVDPMSELPQEFSNWNLFKKIFTFEYRDLNTFASSHKLDVSFLPVGTRYYLYEDEHTPQNIQYDICFVGLGTATRLLYLEAVAKYASENKLKFYVAGHFWHKNNWLNNFIGKYKFAKKCPHLSKYVINQFVNPKDLHDLYYQTKVCLNINTPGHDTFNSRCIDILYCGGTVLTERENTAGYLLEEGKHYYTCISPEDMVAKLKQLLSNQHKIDAGVEKGQLLVREYYTFKQTINALLA